MQAIETIDEILDTYPTNTAVISYRDYGDSGYVQKLWFMGAMKGVDNYESLKEHLAKIKPGAEFLWWAIK